MQNKNFKNSSTHTHMDLLTIVNSVSPSFPAIEEEIQELRKSYPNKNNHEIAEIYGNRIRKKYTAVGVTSALPSIIPGAGTAVQLLVEAGTVSIDLALMLRWMAATCYGIALIYDKNIESEFSQEFITVLGLECGVIIASKEAAKVIGSKVAVAQFSKHFPKKIFGQINKIVGIRLLTKFSTKRGGIAIGKLIPFGIGAAVAGTVNYIAMGNFKDQAIKYFSSDDNAEYVLVE